MHCLLSFSTRSRIRTGRTYSLSVVRMPVPPSGRTGDGIWTHTILILNQTRLPVTSHLRTPGGIRTLKTCILSAVCMPFHHRGVIEQESSGLLFWYPWTDSNRHWLELKSSASSIWATRAYLYIGLAIVIVVTFFFLTYILFVIVKIICNCFRPCACYRHYLFGFRVRSGIWTRTCDLASRYADR